MNRSVSSRFVAFAFAMLAACDHTESLSTSTASSNANQGQVSVSVNLGNVGILARAAQMTPTKLLLQFTSSHSATVADTIIVSGSGTVAKSYSLASQQGWTMQATGLDQRDSVLYTGTSTFNVAAQKTTNVNLSLDARYSSLRVRFPVRDSLTRFVLSVDGAVWGDSSVAVQSRVGDTVKMDHDYLAASATGTSHAFSLKVFGREWGLDTLFYAFDTSLTIVSGNNLGRALTLKWVGPNLPPPGMATLSVTLGTVGQVDLGVSYEDKNSFGIPWNPAVPYGTLLDARDGHSYRTVVIGSQTWMAENLNFAGRGVCYNNSVDSCAKYGRLYTWAEAMGLDDSFNQTLLSSSGRVEQGICPSGWHVPSGAEWMDLQKSSGRFLTEIPEATTANELASTSGWQTNFGTDSTGFRVIPAGYASYGANGVDGFFDGGVNTFLWATTQTDGSSAWLLVMYNIDTYIRHGTFWKNSGASLRCVQN